MLTLTAMGTFGFVVSLIYLIHRLIVGDRHQMSHRMKNVLGEGESPIRKQELSAPLSQRLLRPFLGKSSNLLLNFIPFTREDALAQKVTEAGQPGNLTAREWMVIKALLGVAAAVGIWWFFRGMDRPGWQAVVMAMPGFFMGWFSVDSWLSGKVRRRKETVELELPDILDLLTVSVEAGLGFEGALYKVAEKSEGILSGEFLNVLRESKMGKPRREALREMADRLNVENLSTFIGAVIMAEQLGVSIANVLRLQSAEMRQKRRQRAEETAHKAPIKMLIPMVFFIFPAIFIILLGPAVIQMIEVFSNM